MVILGESCLLYGNEWLTISKLMRLYLEAVEIRFYTRMMRIQLTEVGSQKELVTRIIRKQPVFFRHAIRKKKHLEYVSTERFEGKRD